MSDVRCEGWWEQDGYGRQPMEQLLLQFAAGQIVGSGVDIIGPFTLHGRLDNEKVAIVKQYLGQHSVDYIGTYDGEGTMHGMWSIGFFGGEWMIRIVSRREKAAGHEIKEWVPDVAAD